MILMRDGCAEQCEDAVAGGLHDVAVVAMHRVDHQLQRRVDNRACLLRVEVLLQLGRAFNIRKQCSDRLALTIERFGRSRLVYSDWNTLRARSIRCRGRDKSSTAIATKLLSGGILGAALWAAVCERCTAVAAESLSLRIFCSAA